MPSVDSDQTAHLHSLIRIFTEHIGIAKMQSFFTTKTDQTADAQTDLSSLGTCQRYLFSSCGSSGFGEKKTNKRFFHR